MSVSSEEFSYQTRVVVYNFLGLVPTQTQTTSSVMNDPCGDGDWHNESLKTLPPLSLIDKLKDSETHLAKVRSLNEELKQKVRKLDSSSEPKRPEKNKLHELMMKELLTKTSDKNSRIIAIAQSADDLNNYPTVTVIKKRTNYKIIESPVISSKRNMHKDYNKKHKPFHISSPSSAQYSLEQPKSDRMDGRAIDVSSENDSVTFDSFDCPMDTSTQPEYDQSISSPAISITTNSLISRQQSSMSNSSKICSTYVDINDLNDEEVMSSPELPSSTLELKKEIAEALNELEDEYLSKASQRKLAISPVSSNMHRQSDIYGSTVTDIPPPPPPPPSSSSASAKSITSSVLKTPESEVAERLRALGDQVNIEYEADLNATIQNILRQIRNTGSEIDHIMRQAVRSLISKIDAGWTRVALVLVLGQRILYDSLNEGVQYTRVIAESVANMLEQETGDFIMNHGGWDTVTELDLEMVNHSTSQIQSSDCRNLRDTEGYNASNEDVGEVNDKGGDKIDGGYLSHFNQSQNDKTKMKDINNGDNFSTFDKQNRSVSPEKSNIESINHSVSQISPVKSENQSENIKHGTMNNLRDMTFKNSFSNYSEFSLDESTSFNMPSLSEQNNTKAQTTSDEDSAFANSATSSPPSINGATNVDKDESGDSNQTHRNNIKSINDFEDAYKDTEKNASSKPSASNLAKSPLPPNMPNDTLPSTSTHQPSTSSYKYPYGSKVDHCKNDEEEDDDDEDLMIPGTIGQEHEKKNLLNNLEANLDISRMFGISLVLGALLIIWSFFNKGK